MNLPPELFSGDSGGSRPSPRKELQGPRPAALKVNKDSYKIRKPPVAPPPQNPPQSANPAPAPSLAAEDRQPVIIYAVSPKVIHTTVSDFMNLVQRLTGNAASGSGPGNLSPAARLASIEKVSPNYKDREIGGGAPPAATTIENGGSGGGDGDLIGELCGGSAAEVELGRAGPAGILSPAPGSLPPISPGMFSPALDPFMMGYNMFIPSPSTLFSAPMVSPSPSSSSCDLFNPFFDF